MDESKANADRPGEGPGAAPNAPRPPRQPSLVCPFCKGQRFDFGRDLYAGGEMLHYCRKTPATGQRPDDRLSLPMMGAVCLDCGYVATMVDIARLYAPIRRAASVASQRPSSPKSGAAAHLAKSPTDAAAAALGKLSQAGKVAGARGRPSADEIDRVLEGMARPEEVIDILNQSIAGLDSARPAAPPPAAPKARRVEAQPAEPAPAARVETAAPSPAPGMPTSPVWQAWQSGAAVYDELVAGDVTYQRSQDAVVDLLAGDRPVELLDLGAGTGLLAEKALRRIDCSRVTCLDFSEEMLKRCQQRLGWYGDRARLICADLRTWQAEQNVDAVILCDALAYGEQDFAACYARYAGALKPGGLLLNATVIWPESREMMGELAGHLPRPDEAELSAEARAFRDGPGKRVLGFGSGCLTAAVSIAEHLGMMERAGLRAVCAWRYLNRAVLVGARA